jgi:hypothetical protein
MRQTWTHFLLGQEACVQNYCPNRAFSAIVRCSFSTYTLVAFVVSSHLDHNFLFLHDSVGENPQEDKVMFCLVICPFIYQ